MNEATNNPTDAAGPSAVSSLHDEAGNSGVNSAGAGAEAAQIAEGQGQQGGTQGAAAPKPGEAAPAQGTTAQLGATDQPKPWRVKAEGLPEDRMKFFKDKGYLAEDGHIDMDKFHKSYTEMERFGTESRQALAAFKSQVNTFQTQKAEEKPVTKEEVNQNYRATVQNIQAVNSTISRIRSGQATEQDVSLLDAWAREMAQDAEAEREESLERLREAEYAKKFGLTPKGAMEMDAPDSAIQKANANVLAVLKPEEQTTQKIQQILGNPEVLTALNALAASMFPREYGKGADEKEVQRNNSVAVNRVLASDPELAKSFVELGKAAARVQTVEADLKVADKNGYERGKADALRTLNNGGMQPNGGSVRNLGSGDGTKKALSLHEELK